MSILYGVGILEDRLAQLSEHDSWSGYLFTSSRQDSEQVSRQTVWRRLQPLIDGAGLPDRSDTERPSTQLCRRFWYDRTPRLEDVIPWLEDVATDQDISDLEVVLRNYFFEDRARQLGRAAMTEKLAEASNVEQLQ